jgi:adenylate cyclase
VIRPAIIVVNRWNRTMSSAVYRIRGFLSELARRRLYHVAAAWVAVSFVLWQACAIAFPALGLPDWSVTLVISLTIVGFPVALLLAWAYELTSAGDVEESDMGGAPSREDFNSAGGASTRGLQMGVADPNRIAVLPLANIHPHREDDYFADGITEELISVLSRIAGLDVIARTSAMTYRDSRKPVREIGTELQVGTVLEGSVRKAGERLRITVQLIDVRTEGHLWSQDYDREMGEIFEIQSDIARNVASALQVTLLGPERRGIERNPTHDLEAYDHYLLGRHSLNRRSAEGITQAVEHFRDAVALDAHFAPAHAGLADAYVLAGIGYATIPDAFQLARAAALTALQINGELAEAHAALGFVILNHEWDWRKAEIELDLAIKLKSSYPQAHQWRAHLVFYRHRYSEATHYFERARELDPLSVVIQNESGWPYMSMGRIEEAMARYRRAASLDPTFPMAHFNMGNCHEARGDLEEAIACYQRAVEFSNRTPAMVCFLGAALARAGRRVEAEALVQEVEADAAKGAALSLWLAVTYEALGKAQQALEHLERALKNREPILQGLGDPAFLPMTSLRNEPRYQVLLAELSEIWGWES